MLWICDTGGRSTWEIDMADERRQQLRVEWVDSGTIDFGNGMPRRPCMVSNLSNGGAKLSGLAAATLPDEFTLYLTSSRNSARKCRVIWRERHELGVEFHEPFPSSSAKRASRRVVA
jgi:hypothetical protein